VHAGRNSTTNNDWDSHWSEYADTASINPAQAYRRSLILEHLALPADGVGCRLFEVGSGQGDLSLEISRRYSSVQLLGLDLSETGVAIAQQKVPTGSFFKQDLMDPLQIPERFHAWATHAVCAEVLEHVDDPVRVIGNARQCLAPGARLVVTVPAGPRSAFDRHIGHQRHYTAASLRQVLEDAGYCSVRVFRAGFPFFNLYRLAVVARGKKLISEATSGELTTTGRAAVKPFSTLFRWNTADSPLGWQLIAVAVEPAAPQGPQS
jgi:2-polyprenyl-3-methyl-5-hydroxy-6-metoxy-1,4-benzoquinol methylase